MDSKQPPLSFVSNPAHNKNAVGYSYGPQVVRDIGDALSDCDTMSSGGLTTLEVIDNVLIPEVVLRMMHQDLVASNWREEDHVKLLDRAERIMAAAGLYGEFKADRMI